MSAVTIDSLQEGQEIPSSRREPDAMELFLFSAAIWLPHRIHYDQDYTQNVEEHPGILVHGPLQGVYLMQLVTSYFGTAAVPTRYEFRHSTPVYLGAALTCRGQVVQIDRDKGVVRCEVWAELEDGRRSTAGTIDLALT
jgi:hydroxyacyl-ACP dehydratase HTD2-like protein with hotdog domain